MSVKVDIKLDADSFADYIIHNIYTSAVGIAAIVLAFLNIGLAAGFASRGNYFNMVLFIVFTILIVAVIPWIIRVKVKKKAANSRRTKETVTYEFTEDGIITTTADDSGKASWGRFKKAISRKYILVLYADNKEAIILPIAQMGEKYPEIVDMICEHMPAPAVRVKRPAGK